MRSKYSTSPASEDTKIYRVAFRHRPAGIDHLAGAIYHESHYLEILRILDEVVAIHAEDLGGFKPIAMAIDLTELHRRGKAFGHSKHCLGIDSHMVVDHILYRGRKLGELGKHAFILLAGIIIMLRPGFIVGMTVAVAD